MIDKAELFDDDERYSPAANDLDAEIMKAVHPIFERYVKVGYRIRQVEYVADQAVKVIALEQLMISRRATQ